jgi:hypothetical protein
VPLWAFLILLIMTENKFTYVLFTQNRDNNTIGAYKFGFSRNIKGVFNRCKNGNTWLTHLEVVCYCDFNIITEKQLKEKYKNSRKTKEWFSLSKSNLQEIHLLMSKQFRDDKTENENLVYLKSKTNLLYNKKVINKKIDNITIKETHREIYHIDGIHYGWGYVRASGFGKFTKGFAKLDLNYFDFITSDYSKQNERFFNFYDNFLKSDIMYPYHLLRVLLFSALMSEVLTDKVINSDIFIKHPLANCDGNPERYIYGKKFWALEH